MSYQFLEKFKLNIEHDLAVIAISLLSVVGSTSASTAEPQSNSERLERKVIIEKGTQEQWDRVREAVNEMAKRGIHPMMMVTTLKPLGTGTILLGMAAKSCGHQIAGRNMRKSWFLRDLSQTWHQYQRVFWQILRPEGGHAYPAVVHDYLYWTQIRSRKEADTIFKFALQDSKVSSETVEALYLAVRSFGQLSWDKNAALRKAGECRFLKQLPTDFTTSWDEWKKQPDVCESR